MHLSPKTVLLGFAALVLMGPKKAKTPPSTTLRITKDGERFTLEELRAFAAQVGFPDPNLAAAVAYAESSGYSAAVGDNGKSIGLWQIHTPSHPEYDPQSLLVASYNAGAALSISKGGTDWAPWSTFKSGAYARFLPPAVAAAPAPPAQLIEALPAPIEGVEDDDQEDDDDEPAPIAVEVLTGEDLDQEGHHANGTDTRVRVSDEPVKKGRGRRARRG